MRFCPLLLLLLSPVFLLGQDYLVLETADGKTTLKGNTALQKREVSTASTFKIVLAWAGIEQGTVRASTLKTVADKHVPGSPRRVTLTQAMFYSSNDYFVPFVQEIGKDRLTDFVRRSGLFTQVAGQDWIGPQPRKVVAGGILKTSPELNHAFMIKVASGSWIQKPEVQAELEKAMFWPSPDPAVKLYGKTGTVTGAVWFNGFGKTPKGKKVVTVFIPGGIGDRPRTIQLFYEAFGLKWDDRLTQQVDP